MSWTGTIRSTAPVAMALSGMPLCWGAVPSDPWASVRPPRARIALRPSAPSCPVPDSTTPMASSPRSAARLSKNSSIGVASRGTSGARARRRRHPCRRVPTWPAGMHVDPVRLDPVSIRRLGHRHRGPSGDDLGQRALVIGRHVQDDHKPHAAVGRHGLEEQPERLDAPSRGADADDLHALRLRADGCTRSRIMRVVRGRVALPPPLVLFQQAKRGAHHLARTAEPPRGNAGL